MKISLTIEFPDALAEEFVQLIRNFDVKHDPRHEDIVKLCWVMEGNVGIKRMQEVLGSIDPPAAFTQVFERMK